MPMKEPKSILKSHSLCPYSRVNIRVARLLHSQTSIIPEFEEVQEYIRNSPEMSEIVNGPKQPEGLLPDFYTPFRHPLKPWAELLGISVQEFCQLLTAYHQNGMSCGYGMEEQDLARAMFGYNAPFRMYIDPLTGEKRYA